MFQDVISARCSDVKCQHNFTLGQMLSTFSECNLGAVICDYCNQDFCNSVPIKTIRCLHIVNVKCIFVSLELHYLGHDSSLYAVQMGLFLIEILHKFVIKNLDWTRNWQVTRYFQWILFIERDTVKHILPNFESWM